MPTPPGSRDGSPTRRDAREHRDDSVGQRPRTGITDFERYVRQLTDQQQGQQSDQQIHNPANNPSASSQGIDWGREWFQARGAEWLQTEQGREWFQARRAEWLQGRSADIPTVQSQVGSEGPLETPNRRRPLPLRERTEVEKVLETPAWKSEEVQNLLTQLRQESPGTDRWNIKSSEILVEYEEQIGELNEEAKNRNKDKDKVQAEHEYIEKEPLKKIDTLWDMLKPGGSIYIEREREIRAERRENQ